MRIKFQPVLYYRDLHNPGIGISHSICCLPFFSMGTQAGITMGKQMPDVVGADVYDRTGTLMLEAKILLSKPVQEK